MRRAQCRGGSWVMTLTTSPWELWACSLTSLLFRITHSQTWEQFYHEDSLENPSYYHERDPRREHRAKSKPQPAQHTFPLGYCSRTHTIFHFSQQTIIPSSLHFHHWVACFFLTCRVKWGGGQMAKEASLMPKRVETSFGTKTESNWFLQLGKSISDSMRTFVHSFT